MDTISILTVFVKNVIQSKNNFEGQKVEALKSFYYLLFTSGFFHIEVHERVTNTTELEKR